MSGISTLRVTDASAPALAGTQVIPVLSGVPTLTGFNPQAGPSAGLVTLAALATYLGANVAGPSVVTDNSGAATSVGAGGATNPAFVVDASTASQVSGVKVKGGTSAGTVAISAISPGADTNLTLDAKGSGTIGIGTISTGRISIGVAAGTNGVTIDGTGYGAGVASVRFNGLTTAVTNNLVGTLTNSPVTGNPTFWMPVSIAGVIKYIPCF